MATQTFTRVLIEAPPMPTEPISIDPLREDLARRASDVLDYGLLNQHLQNNIKEKAEDFRRKTNLAKTFQELEIKPFDNQEVEDYKASEKKLENSKSFRSIPLFVRMYSILEKSFSFMGKLFGSGDFGEFVALSLMIVPWVVALVNIAVLIRGKFYLAAYLSPISIFGICTAYLLITESAVRKYSVKEWDWKELTFKECQSQKIPVPDFALETAIRVKEKIPSAILGVNILMDEDRMLGDPFLFMKYNGKQYYLEVWEESKFEDRME
jgi:hypothetical protein